MTESPILYLTSPPITNEQLNDLFDAAWPGHTPSDFAKILSQSLLYICAYEGERLVGFVNVAWNGGIHAFILDTTVTRISGDMESASNSSNTLQAKHGSAASNGCTSIMNLTSKISIANVVSSLPSPHLCA
jgi:hypothetical protein